MVMDESTRRIVNAERLVIGADGAGVLPRWRSGREWAQEREGRTQIPRGRLAGITHEVERRTGIVLSHREIQRRMQCADAYPTEAHLQTAIRTHRTWSALCAAGFPAVDPPPQPRGVPSGDMDPLPNLFVEGLYQTYDAVPARQVRIVDARRRHERDAHRAAVALAALDRLADAVGGDESRTIGEAVDALAATNRPVAA